MTDLGERPDPLAVLGTGIDSYRPQLRDDGELIDPIFGVPTQYGTPYHAWGNAVLAAGGEDAAVRPAQGSGVGQASAAQSAEAERRADRIDAALRGLTAAIAQVADIEAPPPWSGFDRSTIGGVHNISHRDFFWPPILKTHALLTDLGADSARLDALWERIRNVNTDESFGSKPPSNWSMVWISGEWLRMKAGGSPHTTSELDDWLQIFFDRPDDIGFLPECGFYAERGLPNSYDLFTRVHLADILANGYDGRLADRVAELLTAGLRRSLAVQLSDGSLASGFRSTGQTWTVGAQIAFFTHAITLGLGTADERQAAAIAAERALINFGQWQRTGRNGSGTEFSPVQNRQPGWRRIGYEGYSADGHYANLALGFLATAIRGGLYASRPEAYDLDDRPAAVRIEGEPLHRAVASTGRISVAVQACADHVHDGNGIVDVAFGSGRLLQLISSARHLSGIPWFNPGLGVRDQPGRTTTAVISGLRHRVVTLDELPGETGIRFSTVIEGDPKAADREHPLAGVAYQAQVVLNDEPGHTGIEVTEALPGRPCFPVLYLPYPVDLGDAITTSARFTSDGAILELHGTDTAERLQLIIDAPITGAIDASRDYVNRRGECGLLRFDLDGPAESVSWRLISS